MPSNNQTKLKIITPNGIFFDDFVDIVTLKTIEGGYIGLQKGRIPFTASLDIAPMSINHKNANNRKDAAIGGGIVVATQDTVEIITNDIIFKEDINLSAAEKDRDEYKRQLQNAKDAKVAFKIEIELKRAINKVNTKKGL